MPEKALIIGEGTGVEVARIITHHVFFYGHFDAELDQRQISPREELDPNEINWPSDAIMLRIMHKVTRVRTIWGEDFPGEQENLKSRRVFLCKGAKVCRTRKDLDPYRKDLRDFEDATRLIKLGNVEAIVVVPERKVWGKLRYAESVGGIAGT